MRSSLEQAISFVKCDHYSWLRNGSPINAGEITSRWLDNLSLFELANPTSITKSKYCDKSQFYFFVNNENSLMLTFVVLLKLFPRISYSQLSIIISILQNILILIFICMLASIGFNPLILLLIAMAIAKINSEILISHPISCYGFLLPCMLACIGIWSLFLKSCRLQNWKFLAPTSLLVGFSLGIFANFRSSYILVLLATSVVYLIFFYVSIRPKRTALLKSFAIALFAILGFRSFKTIFISPIIQTSKQIQSYSSTHHPIMHPVVLSLAIPSNDFAKSKGIEWNDSVGLKIAETTDPTASYLGPNYEKALFTYYVNLWTYFSSDMLNIYKLKIQSA
ncbi:MAG: hypothetical protein KDD22_05270, partial [Bdellovibrionales bacterium]|nr:hypothetical protein [Bdellovibrionales bacterium]